MELVCVLIGLELLVLVAVRQRIAKNQRLLTELRRCHADLAAALAHLSTFGFDPAAARRIVTRWPDYDAKKKPPPPGRELNRLH